MEFGDFFISKLCDRELMENLANKDPEKLARIFRLVFDRLEKAEGKAENPSLEALINAFGSIEGDEKLID